MQTMIGNDLRLVSGRWERDVLICTTCEARQGAHGSNSDNWHDQMQVSLCGDGVLVLCSRCNDTVATN